MSPTVGRRITRTAIFTARSVLRNLSLAISKQPRILSVRPEEFVAVEVDEMVGIGSNPNFRFPGNFGQELLHEASVGERSNVDQSSFCFAEKLRQFGMALSVHRPNASHGLKPRQPWFAGLRLPSLRGRARPSAKLAAADEAGVVVGQRQRTSPVTAPRSAALKGRRGLPSACAPDCQIWLQYDFKTSSTKPGLTTIDCALT